MLPAASADAQRAHGCPSAARSWCAAHWQGILKRRLMFAIYSGSEPLTFRDGLKRLPRTGPSLDAADLYRETIPPKRRYS